MKLLAIETASDACSCALLIDDQVIERHRIAPRQHAELVLSMVEQLLAEAGVALVNLDALAFGRGPGSFTGVRVATGVVQGLAYGADLPVAAVSSLQALAQGAWRDGANPRVLAAFDARMDEVYWGAYQVDAGGLMTARGDELAAAPQSVPLPAGGDWLGVGQGWNAYSLALAERMGDKLIGAEADRLVRAVDVATLGSALHARGQSVDAALALPVYVRNKVARKRGE